MMLPTDNTKSTNFLLNNRRRKRTQKINFVIFVKFVGKIKNFVLSVLSVDERKNFVIFGLSVGKIKIIR